MSIDKSLLVKNKTSERFKQVIERLKFELDKFEIASQCNYGEAFSDLLILQDRLADYKNSAAIIEQLFYTLTVSLSDIEIDTDDNVIFK